MKPLYRKLPSELKSSFSVRHDVMPNFGNVWHYHAELELHYTIRGEGIRFIGDNISQFAPGEIILVGEKLPHAWRCKDEYFQNNPDYNIEAIVMQFLPDCLGDKLLQLPESYLIPRLFERAKSGILVQGEAKHQVAKLMQSCVKESGLGRVINLLQILKTIAETEEWEPIVKTQTTFHQSNEADSIRINNVFNYTYTHYKEDISLEEVASIANLSVTSFCRYFKLMTTKTYYDFLIEIRISNACRLLVENKLPTEMICFECGFNNVSNFYRHFKKVMGLTPLEYKKTYLDTN